MFNVGDIVRYFDDVKHKRVVCQYGVVTKSGATYTDVSWFSNKTGKFHNPTYCATHILKLAPTSRMPKKLLQVLSDRATSVKTQTSDIGE